MRSTWLTSVYRRLTVQSASRRHKRRSAAPVSALCRVERLEQRQMLSAVLASPGNITFTENAAATAVASGLTVADASATTQASATVSITNFVAGEDALGFTNDGSTMGNIAVASNVGGVLTLTSSGATATNAEWQAALRAVTYVNTSDNPTATVRTVAFVTDDGLGVSNTLNSTVNISVSNDAPVVAVSGNVNFTENGAAVAIDTGLTIVDLDNTALASATVTISNFVAGQDSLSFTNDGSTMGNIAVSTNASGTMTLTSAGNTATVAQWQAALRSVTYVNTSDNPNVTARLVSISVNDGTSASNSVVSTVNITATNDAPQLSGLEISNLLYAPNQAATAISSSIQVSDADSSIAGATVQILANYQNGQDTLAFTNTANITGVFNAATGTLTLTGVDTAANYQAALQSVTYVSTSQSAVQRIIGVQVTDGVNTSNTLTRAIGGVLQLNGTTLNVYGTTDIDVITVSEGANLTIVRDGETFTYAASAVTALNIYGNDGNDSIQVNSLAAGTALQLFGGNGNDTLKVASTVTVDATLNGEVGNDLLIGGAGNDTLVGGVGSDYMQGFGGNDVLIGGDGFNYMAGGVGDDHYVFNAATVNQIDTVVEAAAEGSDLLDFASLTTAVTADLTSDSTLAVMDHRIVNTGASGQAANFENVTGGSANDKITGNAASNILIGNGGDDNMSGGSGNDILSGGLGNDTLKGISGQNILIGGGGADLLLAGNGGDLMMAGSLNFDTDPVALQAVLSEWAQATTYQTRVDHLLGTVTGGLNGTFVLNSTTGLNDNGADYLVGGAGADTYLASSVQDVISAKTADEVFTQIDLWT